jgi:hypothetical protein
MAKRLLKVLQSAAVEGFEDLRTIKWLTVGKWIFCVGIFILVFLYNFYFIAILSVGGSILISEGCPDGYFTPFSRFPSANFTADFFQINLILPPTFSFAQAKLIDVAWDTVNTRDFV